ncbi:MAG: GNAT family N-acetyltransferase [Wenzhouxiangella sp.]|jgi:predicted GNAT family acetyltransferase|nr:GNAT family N-acetyltransferase [Wenzhouxiangella sp.]
MSDPITHQTVSKRFEMRVDGHLCTLDYSERQNGVSFDSVQVPKAVGGRGLAGKLTRHALDWARSQGLSVQPTCPYVARWIDRHPDYADLLP